MHLSQVFQSHKMLIMSKTFENLPFHPNAMMTSMIGGMILDF